MSKPTSLEDADSAIEMQKGDTVQSSNDNIDTLENILDKYYAPIKLPDYNRTNLIQALNLYIEEKERLAYGRGTVDTLDHIKAWADKTEITYNDMMLARLEGLKGDI